MLRDLQHAVLSLTHNPCYLQRNKRPLYMYMQLLKHTYSVYPWACVVQAGGQLLGQHTMHPLTVHFLTYHIAGNIGVELNLADWQFWKQTAKLKSANVSSMNCFGRVWEDWSNTYHAWLLQKQLPFGLYNEQCFRFGTEIVSAMLRRSSSVRDRPQWDSPSLQ